MSVLASNFGVFEKCYCHVSGTWLCREEPLEVVGAHIQVRISLKPSPMLLEVKPKTNSCTCCLNPANLMGFGRKLDSSIGTDGLSNLPYSYHLISIIVVDGTQKKYLQAQLPGFSHLHPVTSLSKWLVFKFINSPPSLNIKIFLAGRRRSSIGSFVTCGCGGWLKDWGSDKLSN